MCALEGTQPSAATVCDIHGLDHNLGHCSRGGQVYVGAGGEQRGAEGQLVLPRRPQAGPLPGRGGSQESQIGFASG